MAQGLSGVVIPTRTIEVPGGGSFAVRGLSLVDLSRIYAHHTGELGHWFDSFVSNGGIATGEAVAEIAQTLIVTAPVLAANAIAAASDADEDGRAIAAALPFSVQMLALIAIGELTFTEDMPPKKVLEIVIRMAGSLTTAAPSS